MKRSHFFILIFFGLISVALLLGYYHPDSIGSSDLGFNILYSVLLISLMGSSVILQYRDRTPLLIKHILMWGVIIMILAGAYHFRSHFNGIKNALTSIFLPSHPVTTSPGSVTIYKSQDEHFYVSATVNSNSVQFMVDTGASQTILTKAVAKRIGIDIAKLRYTQVYNTANGQVYAAPIRLKELKIGELVFTDVPASVNQSDMDRPLLGMSFLNLLSGYEVKGDTLVLRK